MARYPYLTRRHRMWFVRMIVPPDVQGIIGQKVLIETTGETDEHRAAAVSPSIIARFKERIGCARLTAKPLEQVTAETLAARYRAESAVSTDRAQAVEIADVVRFTLRQIGQNYAAYGRQVREADYDAYAALRLLPRGEEAVEIVERLTGRSTPFDAYLDEWRPHAGLKARPLDQAISTIRSFTRDAGRSLQDLRGRDVQKWVDKLINAEGDRGTSAKTVQRKLSELRNYWGWMQSQQFVPDDLKPFTERRVRDPVIRRKVKAEERQRWRPEDVVRLWKTASARKDLYLSYSIRIAAYSGARIEGVAQLKVNDIQIDRDTGVRYMCMTDKSAAGDRHVPVHPQLDALIDDLIRGADKEGYLIHSAARNKYEERSQPLGKRFGRLKKKMGFDARYVFHSIRKTVTSLLQDAGCPEGVAADIVGHLKPTMTYGLYGGLTRMDERAQWLAKAVVYPSAEYTSASSTGSKQC